MKNFVLTTFCCFLLLITAGWVLDATTINGITNNLISGFTAHGILLGQGSTADVTALTPGTSGLPLISQGSSSDPAYVALGNGGLTNSSVTVNTTGCISGGGTVSLGASLTLNSTTCGGVSGVVNASPGSSPTWVLASGDISYVLSAGATITVTVSGGDQWVHHTAHICQPGSGGPWTLTWPSNVKGGMVIGTTTSKCSTQAFESYDGTNLYAIDTGNINQ
jgi:hypothetical protein